MKVVMYGLGALGSNLLVQLARQYPDFEFVGVDFDKVEERNLRTQAYFMEHVGLFKADALRIVLSRSLRRPKYNGNKIKVENEKQAMNSATLKADLSIDCFDNAKSRSFLSKAKKHGLIDGQLLHVGFSPHYTAECFWDEDYDVPGDVDPKMNDVCEMTEAVGFINFVVSLTVTNLATWLEDPTRRTNFIVTSKNKIQWL